MKPYLIGVTGNIASGKSVVLQYLENAGALTIDADLIAQDSYLPGNPAWRPILDRFGEDLLRADGRLIVPAWAAQFFLTHKRSLISNTSFTPMSSNASMPFIIPQELPL